MLIASIQKVRIPIEAHVGQKTADQHHAQGKTDRRRHF
jgi:hypothetical protein